MLRQAQYWLLLKVSKTPRLFTYGAGAIVAVLLLMMSTATMFLVDKGRIASQHAQAMQTAQALVTESRDLLNQLVLDNDTSCESEHLIRLNALLIRTRFIREIGILDNEGRLVCTTTMGRLPLPVIGHYPAITTRSGRQVLIDVPLQVANKKVKATIVRQGRFNVVISPYLTDSLYASADVVWLHTPDGFKPLKAIPTSSGTFAQLRKQVQAQHASTWLLSGSGYEQITMRPNMSWVFQTQRNIGAIMRDNSVLLVIMLISTLLIAVLAVGTLTPYVLRLRGIENRVRFLCDEAHIVLMYQPFFDLKSNRLAGCEVLMRLKEGKHIWMPDQIIPAVLRAGLAHRFDHAVTRKAIRELNSHLPTQESVFIMALNLFPESIERATLMPILQEALSATPRDDIDILIEITEHSLSNTLITEVKGFKAEGFQIAIDDFGTGYSNLKSVTQLSPDLLKIDQSFVFELEGAAVRSTLIPEIVHIAEAVGALTVAEGIESIGQVKLLAAMGVRYGQGYALARPMALGPFLAFLDAAAKTHANPACITQTASTT